MLTSVASEAIVFVTYCSYCCPVPVTAEHIAVAAFRDAELEIDGLEKHYIIRVAMDIEGT